MKYLIVQVQFFKKDHIRWNQYPIGIIGKYEKNVDAADASYILLVFRHVHLVFCVAKIKPFPQKSIYLSCKVMGISDLIIYKTVQKP